MMKIIWICRTNDITHEMSCFPYFCFYFFLEDSIKTEKHPNITTIVVWFSTSKYSAIYRRSSWTERTLQMKREFRHTYREKADLFSFYLHELQAYAGGKENEIKLSKVKRVYDKLRILRKSCCVVVSTRTNTFTNRDFYSFRDR